MVQYALFVCERYYPSGGMDDLEETFDTLEEAKTYLLDNAKELSEELVSVQLVHIPSLELILEKPFERYPSKIGVRERVASFKEKVETALKV